MSVATQMPTNRYLDRPAPSSLADVIETILDKGLVIDIYVRVSLVGIELLTIDARIVIASVDTYLRFAEAVNRLDLDRGRELARPAGAARGHDRERRQGQDQRRPRGRQGQVRGDVRRRDDDDSKESRTTTRTTRPRARPPSRVAVGRRAAGEIAPMSAGVYVYGVVDSGTQLEIDEAGLGPVRTCRARNAGGAVLGRGRRAARSSAGAQGARRRAQRSLPASRGRPVLVRNRLRRRR